MTGPACRELVVLAPNHAPAVGGGALYTRMLAEGLADGGHVGRVTVLTEAHPGEPRVMRSGTGKVTVRRCFPFRTARSRRHWSRYLLYAWENLLFAGLLLRRWPAGRVLLVHASFHYHPNSLRIIVPLLRRLYPRLVLVADVRDPRLPAGHAGELAAYDALIACGGAVRARLQRLPALAGRVAEIPVPFAAERPPLDAGRRVLLRHDLARGRYVFWPHGWLKAKNLDVAVAAMQRVRATHPAAVLAVAGRRRDGDPRWTEAEAQGWLRDLGPLAHAEVLTLAAEAGLVLTVSRVEGMPRSALEAIAMGAAVLLPPGVPEFARHCPDHLAEVADPVRLAEQIRAALDGRLGPAPYRLAAHRPAVLWPRYAALFDELVRRRAAA